MQLIIHCFNAIAFSKSVTLINYRHFKQKCLLLSEERTVCKGEERVLSELKGRTSGVEGLQVWTFKDSPGKAMISRTGYNLMHS